MTTEEAQHQLRSYLDDRLACERKAGRDLRRQGYAYSTPEDFLLQHGTWYAPRRRPRPYPRGIPKQCFANALIAAGRYGLRYVEGYALTVIPVHHAWAVTDDAQLVEVTWPTPGLAYLGVEFSVERADDCTWNGDATILDDYHRRWPLLRQSWTGETPLAVYPTSPWLALVREGRLQEARDWVDAEVAALRTEHRRNG